MTEARGPRAIGVPGGQEFARCTASIDSVRIVLTDSWSSACSFVTVLIRPLSPCSPFAHDHTPMPELASGARLGRGCPGVRADLGPRRPPDVRPLRVDPAARSLRRADAGGRAR